MSLEPGTQLMFRVRPLCFSSRLAPEPSIVPELASRFELVITYYLEMNAADELVKSHPKPDIDVREAEIKNFRFNRFLYQLVGENWSWNDKLSLSESEWADYAEAADLRTWVAYVRGSIAGYYELKTSVSEVKLEYFGLAPDFIGKGYGGFLLSHAIESAWGMPETSRVWVHTCSLDHPNALRNYQNRGFRLYDTVHT